jgi:uncharacterized membrane protein YebE (DUF533 family)
VLNNPAEILSIVLRGALGGSGRKRARKASRFLRGNGRFLTASTVMAAAGVAWGIYDSVKGQASAGPGAPAGGPGGVVPPIPSTAAPLLDPMLQVIRLAVSAARADGELAPQERALILERAREAGLEAVVEAELAQPRPLAEIVRNVADAAQKKELYILAFAIVRADEAVTGAERIYLAQLAHQLGLDPPAAAALETETAAAIDAEDGH